MYLKLLVFNTFRTRFILVPVLILLSTSIAVSASVKLGWDPNDPAPEGYRVFARSGDQPYDYSQPDWEGGSTSCTISSLGDQTDHYFVVRAYADNLESEDSEEVHYIAHETIDPFFPVTDDDGDGMPDDWEVLFGLNPTINDADEDLDQDGISNRDEYRANLEPDYPGEGTAPDLPTAVSPASYAQVKRNPVLELETYSDVDGDAHIATQWQVYDTGSEDCLMDVVTERRLTVLQVPFLLLKGDRTYHWRVRFFDSGGLASQWSAASYLATNEADDDLDGNGITDDQEGGGVQADVSRSLLSPAGCVPTAIAVKSEDTISAIEQVVLLDPAEFEIDETTPDRLPSAMLAYRLVLDQPGQRALVTIHLSDAAPDGSTWFKYDAVMGWQDYSDHTVFSADRQSVIVEVKDGDYGDADGVANGIIVDPAGLSTAAVSSPSTGTGGAGSGGSGGGGCFISTINKEKNETVAGDGLWQWVKGKMIRIVAIIAN